MSIQDTYHFDKDGEAVRFPLLRRFYLALVVILVALLAFGIGRLSGQGSRTEGVSIEYDPSLLVGSSNPSAAAQAIPTGNSAAAIQASAPAQTGQVTASSKGTKYYYSTCKSTVSAANKITFTSASDAEKAGYTLAANCHK